jgi:hypothetical protein
MCMEYMDVGYVHSVRFVVAHVLTPTQLTRLGLTNLWTRPRRRSRKDLRSRARRACLPLQRPPHHAS